MDERLTADTVELQVFPQLVGYRAADRAGTLGRGARHPAA